MATDIRQTGYQSYSDLQKQNAELFNPQTATPQDWYKHLKKRNYNSYSNQPTEYVGLQAAQAGFGESQYDEGLTSATQLGDLEDIRYENQPWYDTLANGLGKMLGTAGTTLVSSLVGLPVGIGTAIGEQRWSGLWDNSVTQAMGDVDDWLEENMKNYQSQAQQDAKWYQRFGDMNWWADNVIKNAGFALGAAGSMALGSGALGLMSKSLGFVDKVSKGGKVANQFLSSLFAATGEGMIEARQGVEERNKVEFQRLDEALAPEYNALDMAMQQAKQEYNATGDFKTYEAQMNDLLAQRQVLDGRKAAGQQQIEESGRALGNQILLGNQVLLTAGNMIQFGKAMANSYDAARHAAETASKAAKPFGVSAVKTAEGTYKTVGKNFGRAAASLKGLLTEGSEEMNQQWIQSSATLYNTKEDVNDYWKAKLDPEAQKETTRGMHALGKAIAQGFDESWGDFDQWEQFFIGGLTGMAGTYSPTKIFNQDKTKSRLNPLRYGEWAGGAVNEIRDFNREYKQYEENIDDLNKVLQQEDFFKRAGNFVARTFLETQKDNAAAENDRKAWEDADLKQNIHDIQAFLRAGKIDDLRAIYGDMGKNLSDEDVLNIINGTTKVISAEDDKKQHDAAIDEQIAEKQRELDALYEEAGQLQTSLQGSVSDAVDVNRNYVDKQTQDIVRKIDQTQQDIAGLEFEKANYYGRTIYDGPYRSDTGYQTKTDDEIRAEVNNNAKELNRKLDSYLESVAAVNEATGGKLTKDQEDNLAYLHNIAKESIVESEKKIAGIREQLPTTFLLKTNKSPEQLTKEYAVSNLTFNKDENTKESYVEVDTSLMDNSKFTNFFIRDVLLGGNIARENKQSENNEKAGAANIQGRVEQYYENLSLIQDNFDAITRNDNSTSQQEKDNALRDLVNNIVDAQGFFTQAGIYYKTLDEYMANTEKVEKDKAKEEEKAQKEEAEQQARNKFEGKTSKQMKQELADGTIDFDDFSDFADMDLSGDAPAPLKTAQEEAKKAQESTQKANSIKQHIQENLSETPTAEELAAADIAIKMIDDANLAADDPSDISIDMPELSNIPLEYVDPDLSIDDVENLSSQVQEVLAGAFNSLQEDEEAQSDIPEEVPADSLDDVEPEETGHDAIIRTDAIVESPDTSSRSEAAGIPAVENPITDSAINSIIQETAKLYNNPSTNGTWRTTTTRHPYGKSTGTYHEDIAKPQFGENSVEYKRSKAIWEYLNSPSIRAFDRQESVEGNKIKAGETVVHFMVRNFANEMYGKDFSDLTDDEKTYSLAIIMLNDNGEVIGDLPLAELEPSYKKGSPTQQVKDIKALQDKVFAKYADNLEEGGSKEAIVDGILKVDGKDNLNMTFNNARKSPLASKVKQVMRGAVPYRKSEKNTLNDIAGGEPFELGVKVASGNIAKKVGDKSQHRDIVAPNVGKLGQPYLLLATPSGEQIAVPFYMPAFNPEKNKYTELYRLLIGAISGLIENNSQTTKAQKDAFLKNLDVLKGLLQVTDQKGRKVIRVGKDSITLHLQNLTDSNIEYDVSVSNTSGNTADIARMLVDSLGDIPINVSLQFLNGKISVGSGSNSYTRDYNKVIGEIADANLPKGTTHTVNGWFTIELTTNTGVKPSKQAAPKTVGVITQSINGRNVQIDVDRLVAIDTATGEPITNDEWVNLALAEIKANKPMYKGKKRIQVSINGKLRTYDTEEKRFVKVSATDKFRPKALKISQYDTAMPNEMKATVEALDAWQSEFSKKITFDSKSHKYFIDGNPVDYSVTQYLETLYGKKNIEGDYSHSSAIGNTIDSISRDYFEDQKKVSEKTYPNLNEERKKEVLRDLDRFKLFLDNTYGRDNYVVVTDDDFKLVASMITPDGVKTVGGATDMLVIDSEGKIHIYDFKAKKNSFEDYTNSRDYTAQQNMYRKMLQVIPGIQGKVADLHLVWFNTDYLGNRSATYKTDDSGNVTIIINGKSMPIQDTPTFKTPMLSDNDRKAFIPLAVSENIAGKQLPTLGAVTVQQEEDSKYLAGTAISFGSESGAEQQRTTTTGKTLQQFENEMKQKKVVGRQTSDAWAAIPDSLKLKMANEGTAVQLEYRGKKVIVSTANLLMMTKALQEANMAAKGGNLTVTEAVKPMEKSKTVLKKENERAARKWLADNLPTLSSKERTQFVDKLARGGDLAGNMWGSYRRGVIEIQNNAPMGTVYHEAFHYVLDMVLDADERENIISIAKQEYGISDNLAAEERLASDFRRFCIDENAEGIIGRLKRWFRSIKDRMLRYNRISDQTVNQLFWKINNGELAQKAKRTERLEDIHQEVLEEIRNIRNERVSWNNLSKNERALLKDSGLSEAAYGELSLDEKEQYIRCWT